MTSFPSKRVSIVDVPEVSDFRATFVYNFFTSDESINDVASSVVQKIAGESFDSVRVEEARRTIPRFVRFDFGRVTLHPGSITGNEFLQRSSVASRTNELKIKDNLSSIQSESEFSGHDYRGFEFQDDNVDRKLFTIVSGSVAKRVTAKNRSIEQAIDVERNTVLDRLSDEHSLLDAAKALADETSNNVSDDVIVKALNQIDALKFKLIDEDGQKEIVNDTFSRIRSVSLRGQISSRLLGRIVKNVVNDPMSTFADEFIPLQSISAALQSQTLSRHNPNVIDKSEIDPAFNAISITPVDAHDYPSSTEIVGYIIEKYEVLSDGKLKTHAPIIIENADIATAVDVNVAYGRTYVYTIRTIAKLSVKATVQDSDNIVLGTGLISSRRSSKVTITCSESVPPPAPTDFNVIWNYTTDSPFLTWSFPPNRQRDIKKFQIFKRNSINEPFQLIKQYDFDDSAVKAVSFETPDPKLVEYSLDPTLTFLDREFRKFSKVIYTVASVDAHGLSSNYSMQLEISFDVLRNKIKKKIISFSGAPKSYPNMLLNADMFADTMKVSGHSRVRVVFDPEYLKLLDNQGNDLKLLTAKNVEGGQYRLQIINTDIMEQEVVDISLIDSRATRKR